MARCIGFDVFARDQVLPLGSKAARLKLGIEGRGDMSYLSRPDYLSYPGLTEDSTIHLWCQCLWILIAASVALQYTLDEILSFGRSFDVNSHVFRL